MILVSYENAGELEYENFDEAKENIIELVVSFGDTVVEIKNTVNGHEYSCEWDLKFVDFGPDQG